MSYSAIQNGALNLDKNYSFQSLVTILYITKGTENLTHGKFQRHPNCRYSFWYHCIYADRYLAYQLFLEIILYLQNQPTDFMKNILFITLFISLVNNLTAQKTIQSSNYKTKVVQGYIVQQDKYVRVNLIEQNKRFTQCHVRNQNDFQIYSPNEISEYGFDNGASYLSKEITIGNEKVKLFLERFYYGEKSFFFLKQNGEEYYFIESNQDLTRLTSQNLSSQLNDLSGKCNSADGVKLSKKSILKFIDCTPPKRIVVFSGGYGSHLVKDFPDDRFVVGIPSIFDKTGNTFSFSAIQYQQIRKTDFINESNFYLGYGLGFTKYSLSNEDLLAGEINGVEWSNYSEVESNLMRISVPLMVRYWKSFGNIGFIANVGLSGAVNLGEVKVSNIRTSDNVETLNSVNNIAPPFQIGLTGHLGLSYRLNQKLSAELTYGGSRFLKKDLGTWEKNTSFGIGYTLN